MIRNFLMDEDGMGTVELVLIIAALVTIAIIFRNQITDFVKTQLENIFGAAGDASEIGETVQK